MIRIQCSFSLPFFNSPDWPKNRKPMVVQLYSNLPDLTWLAGWELTINTHKNTITSFFWHEYLSSRPEWEVYHHCSLRVCLFPLLCSAKDEWFLHGPPWKREFYYIKVANLKKFLFVQLGDLIELVSYIQRCILYNSVYNNTLRLASKGYNPPCCDAQCLTYVPKEVPPH